MKIITFRSIQTKKRANSKNWDLDRKETLITQDIPALVNEPKLRAIDRIIVDVPDTVALSEVANLWSMIDMTLTPFFFQACYQLGCTFDALEKATERKRSGQSDFAEVTLGQLRAA